jgi:hypothetical protein
MDILSIAKALNGRAVPFRDGTAWVAATIGKILANPKYIGSCVWGRTSQRLQRGTIRLPKERWVIKPNAFQPIISEELFEQAQQIRGDLPRHITSTEMLERLRKLLAANGRLTQLDIDKSRDLPCVRSYQKRFGTIRKAYALIGYKAEIDYRQRDLMKRNTIEVRDRVIAQIVDAFPRDIFVLRRGGKYRPILWVRNGPMLSVAVCRTFQTALGNLRWYLDPARRPDRALITILVRCKLGSTEVKDLHVMPQINRAIRFVLMDNDPWLRNGQPLAHLRQLLKVVREVQSARAKSDDSQTLLGHGSRNRHERYSPRRVFERRVITQETGR